MIDILSNSPLRIIPTDYCDSHSDRWFTIPSGLDAGKKLFYSDQLLGDSEPTHTVLFVHGNPECSYTYRHVQAALKKSGTSMRVVSPDHIGFGISDQADFEMVDMHHAANLKLLIEHLDLKDVILVVHDWGGPIGIGAFLDQMERVAGLAVLNTTVFPIPSEGITYDQWPLKALPWSSLGWVIPQQLWGGAAASVLEGSNPAPIAKIYGKSFLTQLKFAARLIPKHSAAYVFSEQLRSQANARSSQRNVRQTPRWGHGYRYTDKKHGPQDNHEFYRRIQTQLPAEWGSAGRNIPVAGHFGTFDPCGKSAVREQWVKAMPRIKDAMHVYPDVGHFVEEFKGPEIAQSICQMLGAQ